ncbi:Ribosomal RNA small subunit methyltransferase E [Pseudonocardia sp. Ae168_Ps1]|uniref:16S rRNA (uracil(1498)-N(3))-methyltransferase n=1 Tax=unclassified Pseudonocardia TaxID=2619320 RepID=UPI00094B1558|nr:MULTISPECIES: 16S rRNA (uracil(1498)-N(3))-methyltransferase [unclassified Pseudonocardia]OLL73156.1 Ribosomal RNA small subunit methyltransferase E [Pseudonocardia sp. Ae150A_Ps1]OLL79133.1 Ribosomal RNA small subunit methyltransferase E [Pseudonocardia sp. Ae168_Ps1]OLL86730.1 Ribosomal RNA small subunit methyltransferase E [Pseudonocardia sp. Ae263_Ps1]OLL93225.1 Ribosomal RNA small subunit methyltransferase E [Pseudonocardia sp. Ae356_Ps1]
MTTAPLFLVDDVGALPGPGGRTLLDGPEGRHAATVRRLRPGEALVLSDGRGGLAHAEVVAPEGKDALSLRVLETLRTPPPAVRLVVAQALVKGDRGELAVETATEAGADGILPWTASRCVARWDDGPRGAKALARWRSTVREAAKQARRPWQPEVGDPVTTRQLARRVADADVALVLHESAGTGLADVPLPDAGEVLLAVGPEGGVDDHELALLADAGAVPVRMGPEVLRASTAACVALGALAVRTGRWSG